MQGISVATLAALAILVQQIGARALPAPDPTPVLEERATQVTVAIASGTVIGSSSDGTDSFNGIPFAQPPTGSLRLKPPQPLATSIGTFDATGQAAACPQMVASTSGSSFLTEVLADLADSPFVQTVTGETEDCLTIDVIRPTGTTADAGLPVLFWIFGGGFEVSWSTRSPRLRET